MTLLRALALVAAAALAATPAPAAGSAKRPLTVADLWALDRVGTPALSPDGRLVAYTVTAWSMTDNTSNSDLWIAPTDGSSPPRRMTWNERSDTAPVWSPDGTRLAFLSRRQDGPPQLHVLPVGGGEAERVTSLPVAVEDAKWLPDGRRIVFVAQTWPDLDGDFAAVKKRLDEREKEQAKAHASESRLVRFWDRWVTDGRFPHFFVVDLDTRKVTDLTPGMARFLGLMDVAGGWDVSPDGAEIAFSANATPPPYATMNYDVFVVATTGGEPVDVTADNPADDSSPRYSPDGRHLVYGRSTRPELDADFPRLVRRDRHTGASAEIAPGWDHLPDGWTFTPDGATLLLHAERRGRVHVWSVPVDGGTPRIVAEGGTTAGVSAGPGGRFAFQRHGILVPPRIVVSDLGGGGERTLVDPNTDRLAALDLGSVEDFRIRGAGGDEVQVLVTLPPGFVPGEKRPLLQVLHGGPHQSWTDGWHWRWNAALFAAKGHVVAMVNFHGSTGEGQKFAESIVGAHGDKPLEDVMKATDALVARGLADPERLAVLGGSYGGYLTAWTVSQTSRFRAAVVHCGVYDLLSQMASDVSYGRPVNYGGTPWESPERIDRWSPSRFARGLATPTLVIHGERDFRVPVTQGLELYGVLQAKGVPSRLLVFPDENHWISKPQSARRWWEEVFSWLDRWLRPAAP